MSSSSPTAAFRADIAALRALAVLLVIAFHYGVPGFQTAFIGVDIFFVISGYLMTQLLVARAADERRGWWAFYGSRASRIYPAMVALMAVLLALGYFFLEPAEYVRLGRHAMYAIAGVVNYRFYAETDYFAPERESIWLLHLWSLSVELQFYLLAPLVIWWTHRRRGWLTSVLIIGGGLSFAAALYAGIKDASAVFYFTPFRLWEFFCGALAFQLRDAIPARWRSALAPLGLPCIAAGLLLLFRVPLRQPLNDVAPVLGAALVLAGASDLWVFRNAVSRLIGELSYSLYLWHWPVWVAARHFGRTGTAVDVITLVTLTLVLALVWRTFVERPFHARTTAPLPRWRALAIVPGVGAVAVVAAVVVLRAGMPDRVPAAIAEVFRSATTPDSIRQDRCFLSPPAGAEKLAGECFASAGRAEVMLFGDSHAAHLWPGFAAARALQPFRLSQVTAGACPPLSFPMPATAPPAALGASQFDAVTGIVVQCPSITRRAFDYIERTQPQVIVFSARWAYYDTHSTDVVNGLRQIVQQLAPLPVKVVIVGPIPEWTPALPQKALEETFRHGGALPPRMHDSSHGALQTLDHRLSAMSRDVGATYVSLRELLCNDEGCMTEVSWHGAQSLISRDSAHLTVPGSQWIVDHGVAPAVLQAAGQATGQTAIGQ